MTTQEFIIAAANDPELTGKLAELKTPEDIYACALEAGLTDTLDEFKKETKKLKREAASLSEEDLDDIAGGKMMPHKFDSNLNSTDKIFFATVAGAVGIALATGWLAFM